MSRNNIDRTGAKPDANPPPIETESKFNPLHFVAPTEFVELPSKGMGYDESHPLCNKDTIEIRFMTAKDEDILSSRTLLKKGLAIERFLDNIIVDKSISASTLLVGDRNAIVIAARISGYGSEYQTSAQCPTCGDQQPMTFNLKDQIIKESTLSDKLNLQRSEGGALGIGVGDKIFMMEFTWYSVISPESCSSILWRSWDYKEKAADALKLTSKDLLKQKIIDGIIKEPLGGAHNDPNKAAKKLKKKIIEELDILEKINPKKRINERINKFSSMGVTND